MFFECVYVFSLQSISGPLAALTCGLIFVVVVVVFLGVSLTSPPSKWAGSGEGGRHAYWPWNMPVFFFFIIYCLFCQFFENQLPWSFVKMLLSQLFAVKNNHVCKLWTELTIVQDYWDSVYNLRFTGVLNSLCYQVASMRRNTRDDLVCHLKHSRTTFEKNGTSRTAGCLISSWWSRCKQDGDWCSANQGFHIQSVALVYQKTVRTTFFYASFGIYLYFGQNLINCF